MDKQRDDFQFPADQRETSAKTLTVPLVALYPIISAFIVATAFFINTLNRIDMRAESNFRELNAKLDNASGDRWKKSYMRQYSSEVGWMNPTLKLPNVDDIADRLSKP